MNPFSAVAWLWKGLRGHSITFAALFASAVIGISLMRGLVHLLGELGVPWLGLWVLPAVIVGAVARRESRWLPDERRRRAWARGLIFGSVAVAVLIGVVTRRLEQDRSPEQPPKPQPAAPLRLHGPSGK